MQHEFDFDGADEQGGEISTVHQFALKPFLARLLRHSRLSLEEHTAILNLKGRVARANIHHDIVSSGRAISHACLIVQGVVGRFDQIADGHRQITALHLPGDICNLHSVVWPDAWLGLEALSATTVLLIPIVELRALAAIHPAIALAFWLDTTVDASICAKWVSKLGRGDARGRLAHLLCELGVRMEQAGLATRTEFPSMIAQAQIADALGLSIVHVNRTMQSLKRDGLIRKRGHMILVDDWERLSTIAEFDPHFLLIAVSDETGKSEKVTPR
jgi:CRP-like cAMP-binding protein